MRRGDGVGTLKELDARLARGDAVVILAGDDVVQAILRSPAYRDDLYRGFRVVHDGSRPGVHVLTALEFRAASLT